MDNRKALEALLAALTGPAHFIRELQACQNMPGSPIGQLLHAVESDPGLLLYPVLHEKHIIQWGDETFVWYDEAGLQGGVEYRLEAAQRALKAYGESLERPKAAALPDFPEIIQPGYKAGEIPHHINDLSEYAYALREQNDAMKLYILNSRSNSMATKKSVQPESPTTKFSVVLKADHFTSTHLEAALEFAQTYLIPRLAQGGAISGPGGQDDAVLLVVEDMAGNVEAIDLRNLDIDLDAQQLSELYGEDCHPRYTLSDWREAVDNEDTMLGYWAWVEARIEERNSLR